MIDLKERRQRLAKALRILSPTPTIVSMSDWNPTSGTLTITAGTRLMKTDKRFTCRETFVNPRDPWLESFQYAVEGPPSEIAETALFRYECHPNIDNPTHYKCVPHFHPKEVCADPELLALHYPFTRARRETVAFAIIHWIRIDFLNRFGHSLPGAAAAAETPRGFV